MARLQLTLYDNAISFAKDALSNAVDAEEQPERWKFAILSLVQAIELSLKELLRLQHPLFVYTNIDNPDKTVSITQAKNRIHKIANVELTEAENSALRTASAARNRIVHHEVDEALPELKLVFARLLGFLNDFHRTHFEEPLQAAIPDELWTKGVEIADYGQELFRRAKERLQSENLDDASCVIACPKCGWEALPAFGENQDKCYVCGNIEHTVLCERCHKIMIFGDHEDFNDKTYCWDCLTYITDDYWYEQAHGK